MIAIVKFVHIAALLCWCAALIALPLLMHHYRGVRIQSRFTEFRLITHFGYIAFASPAAVVTIGAGTALIFLTDLTDIWLMIKLIFVAGLTLSHAWIGHLILRTGETEGRYQMPNPLIALVLAVTQISVILLLVMAKPDLGWLAGLIPADLLEPQGGSL